MEKKNGLRERRGDRRRRKEVERETERERHYTTEQLEAFRGKEMEGKRKHERKIQIKEGRRRMVRGKQEAKEEERDWKER